MCAPSTDCAKPGSGQRGWGLNLNPGSDVQDWPNKTPAWADVGVLAGMEYEEKNRVGAFRVFRPPLTRNTPQSPTGFRHRMQPPGRY
ncbi:hypothetical protein FQN52_004493 [Onygenales sp. PD_12]|nr:hypothetical protein FQN52_004493 [Onygenales sp. PD_12]